MILIIDNFDSFTFNLLDYIQQCNVECEIIRNDIAPDKLEKGKYSGILLSPGPGKPSESGYLNDYIDLFKDIPMLGVCLGHQAIGAFFGARVIKSIKPMHGKRSTIISNNDPLFTNIPEEFKVVRYHSLVLDAVPDILQIIAREKDYGEVMAIKHRFLPIYGVQFHPEAILTEYGKEILQNWMILTKITESKG